MPIAGAPIPFLHLTEGWLNLLLPLAWACLAALAVLEEPLVGDRNFWTTRPHRWTALLGAKLAFVVLAIHVPALAADVYVLAARGFPPVPYAGGLLWKQLLLFGAVMLPALALATLVRNFAHFVIAIFGIAALLAVLNGGLAGYPDFDRPVAGQLRHGLVRLVLAAVGIAVIAIQYARRRALGARVIAVAGALAAVLLSTWLPVQAGYAFGSAANLKIALRDAIPDGAVLRTARSNGAPTALLPIAVSGNPPGEQLFGYPVAGVEITTMDGARIESVRSSPNRPFEKVPLLAWTYTSTRDAAPEWLALRFSAPAWELVKNRPVRIRGWLAIQYFRYGATTMLPPLGSTNVTGAGRCTAVLVDDRFSQGLLKVLCESPREVPPAIVEVRDGGSGQQWRESLNSSMTYSGGPRETWLSPLNRAQTFFRLTGAAVTSPGSQWLIPRDSLAAAKISITPQIPDGRALARFEFTGVRLSLQYKRGQTHFASGIYCR